MGMTILPLGVWVSWLHLTLFSPSPLSLLEITFMIIDLVL